MSYMSITFMILVVMLGLAYYLMPKKCQWGLLLLASLVFYVFTVGERTVFLLLATGVIYVAGLLLERQAQAFDAVKKTLERDQRKERKKEMEKRKKRIVGISTCLLLLMIATTKYANFFGSLAFDISHLFGGKTEFTAMELLLPLGISYYTLMAISYVVDVHRGTIHAEKNPLMLLLYLCYVPHIVEGPFDRFGDLETQFRTPVKFDYDRVKQGAIRVLWGVFKKLVIADRAGMLVNVVFENDANYNGATYLLVIALYTLQIYAEFSGCMDLVCGISSIFGVSIAENFRQPFFSRNINEFWRRWHITLGLWLKDYVFFPVSLSEHFKAVSNFVRSHVKSSHFVKFLPSAYALFFVWFCNGFWHGASVKYIVYGLYYYALMMIGQLINPVSDKVLGTLHISRESKGYHLFEVARTWVIVGFGMLIFRSKTLGQAGSMFGGIFTRFMVACQPLTVEGIDALDYVVLALAVIAMIRVSVLKEKNVNVMQELESKSLPVRWLVYFALIYGIILLGAYGGEFNNTTFIYGEF